MPTETNIPVAPKWKVGPLSIDTKVSVSGVLAVIMAFTAMVGGWYTFNFRQQEQQKEIEALQESSRQNNVVQARISDTLNKTNNVLGAIVQALQDKGIHVRAHLGDGNDN